MTLDKKYISLLTEMLSIPAPSREEKKRADFLESWLTAEGFSVHRVHHNLVVTRNGNYAGASLLMNSHMDTVNVVNGWNTDPLVPEVTGQRITALGSNDAGASVVSLVAAFTLLDSDDIVLVISAEEEISGKIGLGSVLSLLRDTRFAIVGEPTGMQPAVAERGLMVIDAVARGEAGHAARDEGKNAIYSALEDIRRIREFTFGEHSRWLPDPAVNATMIHAGTRHNVIPDRCDFVVDVRSNDKYSNDRLLHMLRETCSSELRPRSTRLKASFLPAEHPVWNILWEMGYKPYGSGTLSDMALLDMPAIKIGPGDSSRSHTANEYILVQEIEQALTGYVEIVKRILTLQQ